MKISLSKCALSFEKQKFENYQLTDLSIKISFFFIVNTYAEESNIMDVTSFHRCNQNS